MSEPTVCVSCHVWCVVMCGVMCGDVRWCAVFRHFVPGGCPGTFVSWNFRTQEYSLPRTFVPCYSVTLLCLPYRIPYSSCQYSSAGTRCEPNMQYEKLNINLSNSSTKCPSFRNSLSGVQSVGVAACMVHGVLYKLLRPLAIHFFYE